MAATFPHTVESIRARFKELEETDATTLQATLDAAAEEIDATVFGTQAAEAHANLVAHKLASSAFGRDARLKTDDRKNVYGLEYERMARIAGTAYRPVVDEADL